MPAVTEMYKIHFLKKKANEILIICHNIFYTQSRFFVLSSSVQEPVYNNRGCLRRGYPEITVT